MQSDRKNDIKKHCVLLLEDDADLRESLSTALELYGFEVFPAANGLEGLEVLWKLERPLSLIITDLMMPKMSGEEFLSCVKESKQFNTIPVIVLSALGDLKHRFELRDLGAASYLQKPVKLAQMLSQIQLLIEQD